MVHKYAQAAGILIILVAIVGLIAGEEPLASVVKDPARTRAA